MILVACCSVTWAASPQDNADPIQAVKGDLLSYLGRYQDCVSFYRELNKSGDATATTCAEHIRQAQARLGWSKTSDSAAADALYQLGQYPEALERADKILSGSLSLRRFPNQDFMLEKDYRRRALIEAANGDLSESLRDFDLAISVNANNSDNGLSLGEAYFQRAIVLALNGRISDAVQSCTQALHHGRPNLRQEVCSRFGVHQGRRSRQAN
jgi:tetratricopeptide (TPR) repeat protein